MYGTCPTRTPTLALLVDHRIIILTTYNMSLQQTKCLTSSMEPNDTHFLYIYIYINKGDSATLPCTPVLSKDPGLTRLPWPSSPTATTWANTVEFTRQMKIKKDGERIEAKLCQTFHCDDNDTLLPSSHSWWIVFVDKAVMRLWLVCQNCSTMQVSRFCGWNKSNSEFHACLWLTSLHAYHSQAQEGFSKSPFILCNYKLCNRFPVFS